MKKDVEVILRELIEKARDLGYEPIELKIETKLLKELEDKYYSERKDRWEILETGIIYHPEPESVKVETFMGLPIRESFETMVIWK